MAAAVGEDAVTRKGGSGDTGVGSAAARSTEQQRCER
jgi:hypothetical protein